MLDLCVFFFFHAEDGIRDWSVTGVQTCALPILERHILEVPSLKIVDLIFFALTEYVAFQATSALRGILSRRSEERRVGKECRSRWWADHVIKKYIKQIYCLYSDS